MCDAATTEVIRDEVLERVSRKEPFTAWDITVEVRKKGVRARHGELKRVVHSLFHEPGVMDGFLRTAIMIPGVPVPPWLYHPDGYDTKEYIKSLSGGNDDNGDDDSNGGTPQPSPSTPSAVKSRPIAANADGSYVRKVGQNNYLYVPTFLVSGAGLSQGDSVHVFESPGKLVVSAAAKRDGDDPAGSCIVDVKGKIRLHKRFLGKNDNHKMTLQNKEIVIEPS